MCLISSAHDNDHVQHLTGLLSMEKLTNIMYKSVQTILISHTGGTIAGH